jgi:ribosomal protein S27AE
MPLPGMDDFRHNLTPVEVKNFLKTTEDLTRDLIIRYCFKVMRQCPECGQGELCQGGAVSLYSRHMDKITHEIKACLKCGYKDLSMVLTIESL